ncbi:MAG: glycosyltransferase family 25 protein, partial [Rhodospirillales bacterium]
MVPVFVINLARDAERRAAMVAALHDIGIAAEFVPAVDGRALSDADRAAYDRRRCLAVYGVDMLPSELGCYLSHYRLCERIVRDGIAAALILEDDVRLDPALPAIVDALLSGPAQDWLVVRLNTLRGRVANPPSAWWRGREVAPLPDGHGLYRLGTHVLGAGGYLIKRA